MQIMFFATFEIAFFSNFRALCLFIVVVVVEAAVVAVMVVVADVVVDNTVGVVLSIFNSRFLIK